MPSQLTRKTWITSNCLKKKVSIITKSERRFNINSILLSISRIEDLSDNVKCVRIPFNDSVNYRLEDSPIKGEALPLMTP